MLRVILESPFGSDDPLILRRNIIYLRLCLRDSLQRGEAPFASHALYPQPLILDDTKPSERTWGIEAGFAWGATAELCAVYQDFGISKGMEMGIAHAQKHGIAVERRNLLLHASEILRLAEDQTFTVWS